MSTGRWALWPAAGLGLVAYGGLVRLDATRGTLRDGHVPTTIAWYLLAFVAFGLAVWWSEARPTDPDGIGRTSALWWSAPVVFRAMLWLSEPTLSDDVYRYLWDGHLLSSGVNPYRHVVESPSLDGYDIAIRSLVNNPGFSTPYLPGAEVLFALVGFIGPPRPLTMQIVMTGFDLLAAWLLTVLLARSGLPKRRAVLYLWCPLVIVETAHGAHLDAFMVALSLAAVVTARPIAYSGGRLASPLLLAAATLTRLIPGLLLVVLWWRWDRRQRIVYGAASLLPIAAFAIGPGLGLGASGPGSGTGVFGSSVAYARQWQFNGGVFNWLAALFDHLGAADPAATARSVAGVLLLALVAGVWLATGRSDRRDATNDADGAADAERRTRADLRAMAIPIMGYVVLTTTFHPWYLISLLVFLPFLTPSSDEDRWRWWTLAPWLYLAAAAVFSYLTYLDPAAHAELAWVRRVEWYPTMVLLAAGVYVQRCRPNHHHSRQGAGWV